MSPLVGSSPKRHRLVRFGMGSAWSAHQLALAALTSAGALVFLIALDRASGGFDGIFWLLAPVPALLLAVNGSGAPLVFWALMLFGWFQLTPSGSFSWWSVVAAAGVLLGHSAAALSAAAPPATAFPVTTIHRWLRLCALALGAAVAVGLAVGLLRDRVDGWAAMAQVLALLGLTGGVWLLRSSGPEGHN